MQEETPSGLQSVCFMFRPPWAVTKELQAITNRSVSRRHSAAFSLSANQLCICRCKNDVL